MAVYSFKDVKPAEEQAYLRPGYYKMKPTKVELGVLANEKASKYLGITFETKDGEALTEKFFLSAAALPRLQYLHQAFFNKILDQEFKNDKAVEAYFKKVLTSKSLGRIIVVGGNINDDKVYGGLPFTGFVVPAEEASNIELGEFDEDSAEWKKYVKRSASKPKTTPKNGAADDDNDIPGDDDNLDTGGSEDDLDW